MVHKRMEKKGVQLSGYVYELPLHSQPVFEGQNTSKLPVTEKICSSHICLPIYPLLKKSEAEYVVESFKKVIL